ncbi:FAD binding domain-containing protein [Colletotrichum lupini]|uniref:Delta(24)-sterol reductase n=1 Tax=Colletotrichum lupini TaxID=145971 RepID=A0A9Q8WHP8_9PEZI|nr:FAD binding domain-containing protein [Colletotrichum lupini]UQC84053.1 FAD binding domain-containing protein [Colletotrichum lupini]
MAESIETEYRLIKHRRRVSVIAAKARQFARDGIKYRVHHKTTNSTRPSTRQADEIIDISGLDHVITVDPRRRRAAVEPNVSIATLVTATLKHGLIPAVVPEFPGITVGGAFSGTALESSSFRYGHFEKSVASLEVILGNGNIVTASPVENSDLFSGLAGSCDITLPGNTVAAFLDWVNNNLGIYPVWICPVRVIPDSRNRERCHNINVNVRLWGPKTIHGPDDVPGRDSPEAFERFIRDNKMIEQATRDLGGTKVVYGDNYYTEEEFWRIYDKEFYDDLRDKWGAAGLPSLWDKLGNPNPTYKEQPSRSKAIMKVLLKRDYLLKK